MSIISNSAEWRKKKLESGELIKWYFPAVLNEWALRKFSNLQVHCFLLTLCQCFGNQQSWLPASVLNCGMFCSISRGMKTLMSESYTMPPERKRWELFTLNVPKPWHAPLESKELNFFVVYIITNFLVFVYLKEDGPKRSSLLLVLLLLFF